MNKYNQELLDNSEYDLNVHFVEWINERYEHDEDILDLQDAIDTHNQDECDILFSDSYGIYIPKAFSELLLSEYVCALSTNPDTDIFYIQNSDREVIAEWIDINKTDLVNLKENADNIDFEGYWDLWNDVMQNAELSYKGKKWYLDQDGDLWIKSDHYIHTDY